MHHGESGGRVRIIARSSLRIFATHMLADRSIYENHNLAYLLTLELRKFAFVRFRSFDFVRSFSFVTPGLQFAIAEFVAPRPL